MTPSEWTAPYVEDFRLRVVFAHITRPRLRLMLSIIHVLLRPNPAYTVATITRELALLERLEHVKRGTAIEYFEMPVSIASWLDLGKYFARSLKPPSARRMHLRVENQMKF